MGSEWGLGPLKIGRTTAEVSAIHWLAASRLRRRRPLLPPAVGSGFPAEICGSTGAMVPHREPDERTDSPEPGHLMARRARRRREAGRALGRRAIGTAAPGEPPRTTASECPRLMPNGELGRRLRNACEGGEEGGEQGTN
jgi:hypothetical protein